MLVKFLSYVASIIGARRYKPIFISLAVLTLTVTGITMVASALTGGSKDVASFEQNQTTGDQTKQPASSELKGLNKQQTKEEPAQQPSTGQQSTPAPDTPKTNEPSANPTTPASAPDITLSPATLNISTTGAASLTATATSAATNLTWLVNNEAAPSGLTIVIDASNSASATLRFKTENVAAGSHQLILTVKDPSTGLSTQKTITIVVS